MNKINKYPKISIITPSYNQGAFIEQTINSVINQNYPNLEYIIIDGGSTDNSVDIIKKHEKYLTYWVSEKDGGQCEAINKGFQLATGEIVTWLNSDDYYLENTLQVVADEYKRNKGADIYFGDSIDINENGLFLKYCTNSWFSYKALKVGLLITQPAIFFKRALLLNKGFLNENYHYCMDYELFLRFGKEVKFKYIKKPLAIFRWHSLGKSSKNYFLFNEELIYIQKQYKLHLSSIYDKYLKFMFLSKRRFYTFLNRNMYHSKQDLNRYINPVNFVKCDILFVGIGYSGFLMSGDKNFYVPLFNELASRGLNIIVVSFDDPLQGGFKIDSINPRLKIIHLKRPFHIRDPKRFWSNKEGIFSYRHQHSLLMEHIERVIVLLYWKNTIRNILNVSNCKTVHYIDSFLFSYLLKANTSIITIPRFKKFKFLYKNYLKFLLIKIKYLVIFNFTQKEELHENINKFIDIRVLPWGNSDRVKIDHNKKNIFSVRESMKDSNNILFLYTGFIQQFGLEDFKYAKYLAEKAVALFPNVEFIFVFKPEIKIKLPDSRNRIKYFSDCGEFIHCLEEADCLFSPKLKRGTTISPPLTWIEAISKNIPILTTNDKGISSYFDKESILIFNNNEEFVKNIEYLSKHPEKLKEVGQNAYKVFKNNFIFTIVFEKYLFFYNEIHNNSGNP